MAKALAMRGDALAESCVQTLGALLAGDSEPLAQTVAASCALVLGDSSSQILSTVSHCTVRVLYKQRLTTYLLPAVMKAYQSGRFVGACASAVAVILQLAPPATLRDQLGALLPLLISALPTLTGEGAVAATRAIADLIHAKGDSVRGIEQQLGELANGLLHLAQHGSTSVRDDVVVRACVCLRRC